MNTTLAVRGFIGALGLTVTLCSTPAQAQAERPLVIDVTTMGPTPRKASIEGFLEDTSPLAPGTYPMISLSDPDFAEQLRWHMPTQAGAECSGTPEPLEDAVSDALAAWNQLDLDTALGLIEGARKDLACQASVIEADDLQALLFIEGAVHLFLEDGQSTATFAELAALFPDAQPQPGFPPEVQQSFRIAAAQARQSPDIAVSVPPEFVELSPRIDGRPVPEGASQVTVKSGRHIAQIAGPRGEIRTEMFTLFPGFEESLGNVGALVPDRAQVIGATIRAQLTSGRMDDFALQGLSRYAAAGGYRYLLFVVPDTGAASQMKTLTLDPQTARISEGLPPDLGELPAMEPDDRPVVPSTSGGVKPPRRYDASTSRRRIRVDPTDTHVGGALGVLVYDGVPFVTLEPRYERAVGPVSLAATGILGIGPGADGVGILPGMRLAALKRFYVNAFAPHAGLAYQVVAARVATASGNNVLIIEGTPEVFGGTEWAFNDTGLRLTARGGVAWSPGVFVVGDESLDTSGRLALSLAVGAGWTW